MARGHRRFFSRTDGIPSPSTRIRDGRLEDEFAIFERKWEEVGQLSHIYILFPESQGDASTKIKNNILLLLDLGIGAVNLEIREEICRVNEDQLHLSSAQKWF